MLEFTQLEINEAFETKVLPGLLQQEACRLYIKGKTGSGYGVTTIRNIQVRVHRLAYAYYNQTNDLQGLFILHGCDTPNCVAKEHLRLGTHKENMQDKIDRGRTTRKFTDEEIREVYTSTETSSELAKRLNVTKVTINTIRSRKEWSKVTEGLEINIPTGSERTREASAILTKEQVREVYLAKDTLANLAKQYGTDTTTISKIKCGINWKDVTESLGEAGSSEHPFKAKLQKDTVKEIYLSKETSKVLAIRYGITPRSINQIRSKETWKTFTDTLDIN